MLTTPPLAALLLMAAPAEPGALTCTPPPGARYHFDGLVGERVQANLHGWLLPAPEANPALLEMFRVRDRQPRPDLLPWSGEFVGKYLISAIHARRMVDSPELERLIRQILVDLAACQAEDGYLGPWPRAQRLLGQWDLWGHYHLLDALLDWYQDTADAEALRVARRIGDAVCATFLDSGKRVVQAGSHEMNMAILTGLARLHRVTGEARYLRLAREVEQDWQQAGDYLRCGLANRPFYRTPRPRWESLHDLQGLVELYRLTGDGRYRTAFENLWRSIRALDIHNTGGFTTGEQAVGDPYAQGAIETCCTVAWMAISADLLQLTGDSRAADELERAFYNGGLGAQHPSGRWWTYNTPMNGVRRASAHDIVFQARPGSPELNCCSVNAPRVLGLLSRWAVLRDADGLRVSYYGPGRSEVSLADGTSVVLRQQTEYPLDGRVIIQVEPATPQAFALRLRVPAWSTRTTAAVNGQAMAAPEPGGWLTVTRRWQAGDRVELQLDVALRTLPGDGACAGQVSLFRGPLLLAWDQRLGATDEAALPVLDPTALNPLRQAVDDLRPRPWLRLEVGPAEHRVSLCDFASAGAAGNPYRSWLRAKATAPAPFHLLEPSPGATVPPGQVLFVWAPPGRPRPVPGEQVLNIRDAGGTLVHSSRPELPFAQVELAAGHYQWQVIRRNGQGQRVCEDGWGTVMVADGAAPQAAEVPRALRLRDDLALIDAELAGTGQPAFGELSEARGVTAAAGPADQPNGAVAFNGRDSRLTYAVAYWPAGGVSAACWFRLDAYPEGRIAQVMSAWCAGGDDPLRLTIDRQQVFARIEGGGFGSTPGAPVALHRWYHVAAVQDGGRLRLWLDGKLVGECGGLTAPVSATALVGVGCNPLYSGNECLPGRVSGFRLWAKAIGEDDIRRLAGR